MLELIDLQFQDLPGVIGSYILRGPAGVVLIETGPASTYPRLIEALREREIAPEEITDALLTHIHLDHAGGAGWLARETGATIHVHQVGARHLIDPSRLLASAGRIYGDQMDALWGETRAVPASQVHPLEDGEVIEAAGLRIQAIDTPGHAYHHMAYWVDGLCFTGDLAGIRLAGQRHIRLSIPPPEIDLPAWLQSLERVRRLRPDRLLLTHFGPAEADPQEHLVAVEALLRAAAGFVHERWQAGQEEEVILEAYVRWLAERAAVEGADQAMIERYELVVPSRMCVQGLLRYWRKAGG